jgi:hypothetical protein
VPSSHGLLLLLLLPLLLLPLHAQVLRRHLPSSWLSTSP